MSALNDAATITPIDRERVVLMGISNGGLGVSLTSNEYPLEFAGLTYISPVFDTGTVESFRYTTAWRNRPVLVITGEADRRISVGYVNQRVGILQNAGVDVRYYTYPGEDHFLFFSRRDDLLNRISIWLGGVLR